jgi:UDP-GlcNAc3NAcA epimerase
MSLAKVLSVLGARPQFVKAAVVSRAFRDAGLEEVVVHSGQHYDHNMSDIFFEELQIPVPKHLLGVGSGRHGEQTGRIMMALEPVVDAEEPDWVLVYGDTNTTLAAALVAAKSHVPLAHVEAGLRSFNRRMPEEINRIVADHLSTVLFAPTSTAVANLLHDGVPAERIVQAGDVMLDLALLSASAADERADSLLQAMKLDRRGFALATVHRAENTDDPDRLGAIFEGFAGASATLPIVVLLHPRTRKALADQHLTRYESERLVVAEPVGYLDMVALERTAALIATDSGGVQKEAFFHRTPCVTLRDETEWTELVELGWNRLVPPTSSAKVRDGIIEAVGSRGEEGRPYGSGEAAVHIARQLAGTAT